jgi:hypothetical protein
MRLAAFVLAASILAATPALAQTDPVAPSPPAPAVSESEAAGQAPAQSADQAAQPPQEERRICRTVQRTESRLRGRRERICGTQAEWDAMQDQTAQDARRIGTVQSHQD